MNRISELFTTSPKSNITKEIASKNKSSLNYAICMTPRSGSTLLTNMLQQTGLLGYPNEWFNPDSIPKWIEKFNAKNIMEYVDCLRRYHTSYNGIFGCELPYFHMKMLFELLTIQQVFDKEPIWFYLRRKNIVLQGISLYRSVESGYFHSVQEENQSKQKFNNISYNEEKIKHWTNHILEIEQKFDLFFKDNSISPIHIYYEDIIDNKQNTINLFLNVMRVTKKFTYEEDKIHKISDEKNKIWYEIFINNNESYKSILEKRNVKV